jgi:DUF971 family protein
MSASTDDIVLAPSEVRLSRRERCLRLNWGARKPIELSSLLLRKCCACSTCTHARRSGTLSLIDADINIEKIELFGVSGLQLFFSDGHCRGVYPWRYLRELGEGA